MDIKAHQQNKAKNKEIQAVMVIGSSPAPDNHHE